MSGLLIAALTASIHANRPLRVGVRWQPEELLLLGELMQRPCRRESAWRRCSCLLQLPERLHVALGPLLLARRAGCRQLLTRGSQSTCPSFPVRIHLAATAFESLSTARALRTQPCQRAAKGLSSIAWTRHHTLARGLKAMNRLLLPAPRDEAGAADGGNRPGARHAPSSPTVSTLPHWVLLIQNGHLFCQPAPRAPCLPAFGLVISSCK